VSFVLVVRVLYLLVLLVRLREVETVTVLTGDELEVSLSIDFRGEG